LWPWAWGATPQDGGEIALGPTENTTVMSALLSEVIEQSLDFSTPHRYILNSSKRGPVARDYEMKHLIIHEKTSTGYSSRITSKRPPRDAADPDPKLLDSPPFTNTSSLGTNDLFALV
jgi:hypothetical protein